MNNGKKAQSVTLTGRTLYKDGKWNTLCLPFPVVLDGSPLEDATIMELDATGKYNAQGQADESGTYQTGLDSKGTLYLFFKTANAIEAGKPYIIKWASGDNIVNPTFSSVTVNNATSTTVTASNSGLSDVQFIGNYAPMTLDGGDKSKLYIGAENTLYYPSTAMTINAFRAYFHLNGITIADLPAAANIRMFFGDDSEETGISDTPRLNDKGQMINDSWYDLSGRKLNGKPTTKGLYINNGRKVVICEF